MPLTVPTTSFVAGPAAIHLVVDKKTKTGQFALDVQPRHLKALLRRARGHADNLLECGDIRLDRSDRLAWLGGEPLDLSAYEYVVLESLLERPGRVVARTVCACG